MPEPRPFNPHWARIPEWLLGSTLCLLLIILAFGDRGSDAENEVWKLRRQAAQVVQGCREYARTHEGRWPPSLQVLPLTSIRLAGPWFRQVTPDDWSRLVDDWTHEGRFTYRARLPADPPDKVVLEIWSSETPGREILARADGTTATRVAPF